MGGLSQRFKEVLASGALLYIESSPYEIDGQFLGAADLPFSLENAGMAYNRERGAWKIIAPEGVVWCRLVKEIGLDDLPKPKSVDDPLEVRVPVVERRFVRSIRVYRLRDKWERESFERRVRSSLRPPDQSERAYRVEDEEIVDAWNARVDL
jgi:hypothetical protein